MLYAADVARLYDRVRKDESRLARLEGRLRGLATTSLGLVAAASAEAAAQRLVGDLEASLGARRVAVFVLRSGRYRSLATSGEEPARTSFAREEIVLGRGPETRTGDPWSSLGFAEPVTLVPIPGRGAGAVAFAVLEAAALADEARGALELLARFAGVILESHLVEEAGLEALRPRTPPSRSAPRESVAALQGDSEPMKLVRKLVLQVAPVGSSVLVLGETGTGKELVARAVHDASPRRKGPFVAVNCGALPEDLAESEIFGHEAGAFTGAQKKHRGKVEQASGGTLFLDELGEMPKAVQVKLLRFLQDSRYVPLGGESERSADVRVVAATNRSLDAAVAAGEFRQDLLFRLNVFAIELPALRDRGYDVIALARAFTREIAARMERPAPTLSPAAEKALLAYRWPGNVRELRNVLERAVILANGDAIDVDLLPRARSPEAAVEAAVEEPPETPPVEDAAPPTADVFLVGDVLRPFADAKEDFVARFEARYCEAVLAKAGGNVSQAARLAGMDKKNLYRKMHSYGLDAHDHKLR
jgi:DNA-binding NtrC family response regulator